MSEVEEVIRLAAKGDGITNSGVHIPRTAPGDMVEGKTLVSRGPHHVDPPCRHFDRCGGCQLQHVDEETLASFVRDRVVNAAKGQNIAIGELRPVHLSPPASRRRATLHGLKSAKGAVLGFREGGSHTIVDLAECHVLDHRLETLIAPLRSLIATHGTAKQATDIRLSLCDQGVDVGFTHFEIDSLSATEALLEFAQGHSLARLTVDAGFGSETVWEPEPVTVSLSGIAVPMPTGAFLQATPDAENRMVADVTSWLDEAGVTADLFAGLGTFAFALSKERKVLAVEADRAAHLACKSASSTNGGRVVALHRDLFRNPLQPAELNRFDAVVLDPPRAGAKAQVGQISQSSLKRVAYVSCNPSSWARDAAQLVAAGFTLTKVRPIGQFRWSTHVELASLFVR